MLPDRVSNPGPLTYESGALPIALCGPAIVQSIVSLTSLLRGQLVKCFTTLLPNRLIFFVEKMRKAFALQKLLTFFRQKIWAYLKY